MRNPPKVEPGDLAALSAWVVETRAVVDDLYFMTLDATAKKSERRQAKVYLRAQARRRHQVLGALLAALDPGAPVPAAAVSEADSTGQNDAALATAS